MDTKKDDPAEELSSLIDAWNCVDLGGDKIKNNKEEKIKNIVAFICRNYNEKDDNVWLKQISEHPGLFRELFEKKEGGSFKCSSGIEVVIDNKKLNESDINDILGKIEKKELNLGYEFLLNKDEKHKELLVELNEKIRKWEMLYQTDKDKTALEKQIEDIANFISNHYRTFVARLQQGVRQDLLKELFARDEKTGLFKYKKAHKFLKEAADRGLIFAVTSSIGCDNTFLVDPNDKYNKTLEIIFEKIGDSVENINVCAHALGIFDKNFHNKITRAVHFRTLSLIPFKDNFLSFISSRQTEGVENTCKIINYFTEKYFEQHKHEQHKQRMDVTLEGASQGVDFITKMVGSTHGRDQTRIKNANIELNINAPHIFQDEQKIVNRLTNGAQNENTIKNIKIINDMDKCKHPIEKTISLINHLRAKKNKLNNNGKIELTIGNELKETLEKYRWNHVHNNIIPDLKWVNNVKDDNVINT